jgi:hypothetical protein
MAGGLIDFVREGGGIEARLLALLFCNGGERGREAWDIDCGRVKVGKLEGAEGVVPR